MTFRSDRALGYRGLRDTALAAVTVALVVVFVLALAATERRPPPSNRRGAVQQAIQAPIGDGSAVGRALNLPGELGL